MSTKKQTASQQMAETDAAMEAAQNAEAEAAAAKKLEDEQAAAKKLQDEADAAAAQKLQDDEAAAQAEAERLAAEQESAAKLQDEAEALAAAETKRLEDEQAAVKKLQDEAEALAAAVPAATELPYHLKTVATFIKRFASEMNVLRSYDERTAVTQANQFKITLDFVLRLKDQEQFNQAWSMLIAGVKEHTPGVFSEGYVFRGWTSSGFNGKASTPAYTGLVTLLLTSARVGVDNVSKFQDIQGMLNRHIKSEDAKTLLLSYYNVG
jgi:flagellar biosynthesis GTPase FlhF